MAAGLNILIEMGRPVDAVSAVAPAAYSIAISLKRIADHATENRVDEAGLQRRQLRRIADAMCLMPSVIEIERVLQGVADPEGFGPFRNATELGLAAMRIQRKMMGECHEPDGN
jgi:hypothetical protein